MKKKILLSVAIVAFCAYNVVVLHNAFALDMVGLSSPSALAVATPDTILPPPGPPDGGGGFSCTKRGGTEMPKKILRLDRCFIKFGGSLGRAVELEGVWGSRCQCENKPSGYEGVLGCDLTWETSCVADKVPE